MTDLLPCPFCGSSAGIINFCKGEKVTGYSAGCDSCDAEIGSGEPFRLAEEAARHWNMRATASEISLLNRLGEIFGIGAAALDAATALANVENAARRARCLSKIEGFLTTTVLDDDGEEFEECALNWGDSPDAYLKRFQGAWNTRAPVRESVADEKTLRVGIGDIVLDYRTGENLFETCTAIIELFRETRHVGR